MNRIAGANGERFTPLMTTCINGYLDIIEYLLDNNAAVHLQDHNGWWASEHLEDCIQRNEKDIEKEEKTKAESLLDRMKSKLRQMKEDGQKIRKIPKKGSTNSDALVMIGDDDKNGT